MRRIELNMPGWIYRSLIAVWCIALVVCTAYYACGFGVSIGEKPDTRNAAYDARLLAETEAMASSGIATERHEASSSTTTTQDK